MYIKQVLNNNVVIALDKANNEMIIDAKGIGFHTKPNTIVDETNFKNMKKFILDKDAYSEVRRIYETISEPIINLSMRLLEQEQKESESNQYIPINAVLLLADHLNETVKRLSKGIYLRNALTNEIKMFYHREFTIAMQAKEELVQMYDVYLNDDEVAFIAIHLINLNSNNIDETMTSIQIVDDLVNIVRRVMNIELKVNTYVYSRFITHLKYFSIRILNKEKIKSTYDEKLSSFVKENYKKSYVCAATIKKYISNEYHYDIAEDEVIYLTLHLENLKK